MVAKTSWAGIVMRRKLHHCYVILYPLRRRHSVAVMSILLFIGEDHDTGNKCVTYLTMRLNSDEKDKNKPQYTLGDSDIILFNIDAS